MYHFMLVHNFNEDLKSNALKRDTIQNFETSYLFFFQGLGCHKPKLANHMCLFHMEIITGNDKFTPYVLLLLDTGLDDV